MLTALAIENYRSIRKLKIPLARLNVITGPNGSGKSNLYRALRLLGDVAQGGVVRSLASEGGLGSTFWAGPEQISLQMKRGQVAIEGGPRQHALRLRLGFASDEFGYAMAVGLPVPSSSAFVLDPEIKREAIWAGPHYRAAGALVERTGAIVKVRARERVTKGGAWDVIAKHVSPFDSMFDQGTDPATAPEIFRVRESIRQFRFYDQLRTDRDAPARQPHLGTRAPVLDQDGQNLAAALQTIREIGDAPALDDAVEEAFPGARVAVNVQRGGHFAIEFHQYGLLRPLSGAELSDGTLRYLLWVAALLTPRPPALMVLNEPETSLHPDLLPALASLIVRASEHSQLWVVSHANRLIAALEGFEACNAIRLEKNLGQTEVVGQGMLDEPAWHWPE